MKSDYKNLNESQVKALFIIASASGLQSAEPSFEAAEAERLLAEIGRQPGDAGASLLEQATKDTTSVEELTRLKELAKLLMKEAMDGRHREAARLLYHVAVASAFVHHGAAISGRPMHKQQALYEQFAATWRGHAIGRLFREAVARAAHANPRE